MEEGGSVLTREQEELLAAAELEAGHMEVEEPITYDGIPGIRSYYIQPHDKAAWLPAWELKVDRWGTVYGTPTRLPRGQLEYYLMKKRPVDGGPRFTLKAPAKVLPEAQFQCFVGDCQKRVRERAQLVAHIEACHPQEAKSYGPLLEQLRQAVVRDNPKLATLIEEIAETPDQPVQAVSAPEAVPQAAPSEYRCSECGWEPKPDVKNPFLALASHSRKHRH